MTFMTKRYLYIRQQPWSRLKFCSYLLSLVLKCQSAVELALKEFTSAERNTYSVNNLCAHGFCSPWG